MAGSYPALIWIEERIMDAQNSPRRMNTFLTI
jgi:hypothetical protein